MAAHPTDNDYAYYYGDKEVDPKSGVIKFKTFIDINNIKRTLDKPVEFAPNDIHEKLCQYIVGIVPIWLECWGAKHTEETLSTHKV